MSTLATERLLKPFTVADDGTNVLVVVEAQAGLHPLLQTDRAVGWISERRDRRITVDLAAVELLDSALVSWIITVVRLVGPGRLTIQGATRRVQAQMRNLRLDRLLVQLSS